MGFLGLICICPSVEELMSRSAVCTSHVILALHQQVLQVLLLPVVEGKVEREFKEARLR